MFADNEYPQNSNKCFHYYSFVIAEIGLISKSLKVQADTDFTSGCFFGPFLTFYFANEIYFPPKYDRCG